MHVDICSGITYPMINPTTNWYMKSRCDGSCNNVGKFIDFSRFIMSSAEVSKPKVLSFS
jgi:hypothetical protein